MAKGVGEEDGSAVGVGVGVEVGAGLEIGDTEGVGEVEGAGEAEGVIVGEITWMVISCRVSEAGSMGL